MNSRVAHLKPRSVGLWIVSLPLLMLSSSRLWAQGPPFQTDDPVPVELHHYGFYVFGSADGTPVEMDSVGPAFEFNWGAIPRVQLHGILPFGGKVDSGIIHSQAGWSRRNSMSDWNSAPRSSLTEVKVLPQHRRRPRRC